MILRDLIFTLVALFNFLSIGYSQAGTNATEKVIIEYEDFTTTTSESVKCKYFEETFKKSLKVIVIKDENELSLLSQKAGDMEPVKVKKSVDVRVKVTLCYAHSEIKYCMDRFGVFVDSSGQYFSDKYLHRFVIKHIPREGW